MTDAYTSKDLIQLEDYNGKWTLSNFADGTIAELAVPNESSTVTTGYNGNSLGAHNEPGRQRRATLRLVKGSDDDKRINETFQLWQDRDPRFKPFKGWFTKNIGHSDGSLSQDTTECYFGLPGNNVTMMQDTTGNTEQCVSVYTITFGNSKRNV